MDYVAVWVMLGVRATGWLQGKYTALNADALPRSGFVQSRLCEAEHYAERCGLSAGFLGVSGSPRST